MRYLVQFIIPALIFAGVVYFVMRWRRGADDTDTAGQSDTVSFIVILTLGALVALGAAWALVALLE
jgi:succinate dehydrogenase/fumarate reductase cytochrome b subunit